MDVEFLVSALAQEGYRTQTQAIHKAIAALSCETDGELAIADRFQAIWKIIAIQADAHLFSYFCYEFKTAWGEQQIHLDLMIAGLAGLLTSNEDINRQTKETVLAAQIFFDVYDSTWPEVGEFLIAALDSPNDHLRACAAYQISRFAGDLYCSWWEPDEDGLSAADYLDGYWVTIDMPDADYQARMAGVPPLADLLALIESKEIERPGIAATWTYQFQQFVPDYAEWLLDILARSPSPEAYTPYFSINLAFVAHEIFSDNVAAIRRLIDMGRVDIACAAAGDFDEKIPKLEPLLIEIGHADDPETVRLAAWHLAYHYHYLHPRGAAMGYVEQIELSEIDLFLLFNGSPEVESPYAAVIYPKEPGATFSRASIEVWVDRLFPHSVRGEIKEERLDWSSETTTNTDFWYRSGFVSYTFLRGSSHEIQYATIGYRSNVPWDPRQFV
jgi:hypothetical protein